MHAAAADAGATDGAATGAVGSTDAASGAGAGPGGAVAPVDALLTAAAPSLEESRYITEKSLEESAAALLTSAVTAATKRSEQAEQQEFEDAAEGKEEDTIDWATGNRTKHRVAGFSGFPAA